MPCLFPNRVKKNFKGVALALPENTDPRWNELADRLAAEASSAEERINHTVEYVKGAAEYSLQVGKFHSEQPVAEFFFDKKRGYCQFLASSAAILLRLQGIPTRYVTGFTLQEWTGNYFIVRDRDAHAWLEAYMPGKGWVEADPTPDAELEARRQAISFTWITRVQEWVATELGQIFLFLSTGEWQAAGRRTMKIVRTLWASVVSNPLVGSILLVLLFVLVAAAVRRRWKKINRHRPGRKFDQQPAISLEVKKALLEMEQNWKQRGFTRPGWRGLREHLDAIPREAISSEFRQRCEEVIRCFYEASFGAKDIPVSEAHSLWQAFQRTLSQERKKA